MVGTAISEVDFEAWLVGVGVLISRYRPLQRTETELPTNERGAVNGVTATKQRKLTQSIDKTTLTPR
jgi:hypothetical protein